MFRFTLMTKPRPSFSEAGFTLAEKMVIVAIIGIAAAASAPSMMATLNRAKVKQTMAEVRTALNETQREAIKGNKVCTLTLNFVEGKITGPCLTTGDRTLETDIAIATNLIDPNTARSDEEQPVLIGSDVQPSLGVSDGETISQIAMAPVPEEQAEASKAGVVVQVIAKCKGNTKKGLGLGTCKDKNKDKDDDEDENDGQDSLPSQGISTSIPIKYGVLGNPEFAIISAQQTPADPSGKIIFYNPGDSKATKRCIAISNTLGLTRIGTYQGDMSPVAITDSGRCTAENWEEQ